MTAAAYARYLTSPGWDMTKWLRKDCKCAYCGARARLELHHQSYTWHNAHPRLRWWFPNMFDPMLTLCDYHHARAHGLKG